MPDFSEYFLRTKGKPIRYKGEELVMVDNIPFKDGDSFLVTFEKTNSEWKQGIGFDIFGYIEINGTKYQNKIALWENTSPKKVVISVFGEKHNKYRSKKLPQEGYLSVKNIWDTGKGTPESWFWGAAMKVEEIANGRRYYCNDGHPDENFDDIIFTIQKLG